MKNMTANAIYKAMVNGYRGWKSNGNFAAADKVQFFNAACRLCEEFPDSPFEEKETFMGAADKPDGKTVVTSVFGE